MSGERGYGAGGGVGGGGSDQVGAGSALALARDQREVGGKIVDLQNKAGLQVFELPGDEERYIIWDSRSGSVVKREVVDQASILEPAPARGYAAHTLDSLVRLVLEFASRAKVRAQSRLLPPITTDTPAGTLLAVDKLAEVPEGSGQIFIFASMDCVRVVLDEAQRREVLTFALRTSETWLLLKTLKSSASMKQGAIIDLLRRRLDCTYIPHDIIQRLRRIKFKEDTAGESSLSVGNATVRASVVAEVVGADTLPETVEASAMVWDNLTIDGTPETATVKLAFDTELSKQEFFLRPVAGSIEECERKALERLVAALQKLTSEAGGLVKVFAGDPHI